MGEAEMCYLCFSKNLLPMKAMTYADFLGQFAPEAVIVADGQFPRHPLPLRVLREAAFVCCCDGALETLLSHSLTPQAIVGDGDSLSTERKKQFADRLHIETEQEDNDLTKATRHCQELGLRRIAYVGATGLREDHTIGNISLLDEYSRKMGLQVVMLTDYGYFLPVSGSCLLPTFKGQQVSVFNLSSRRIVSQGLRWPTYPFTSWWQGSLNEALGEEVRLEADGGCVAFLTYQPKTDGRH